MVSLAMLRPVVALAIWTLTVLGVLAARRLPALRARGLDIRTIRGGRGQDLEGVLPGPVQWPAHNCAHLVEQPTLFYAVALALAIMGDASPLGVGLAWAYVASRVIHSLWQMTVNLIAVRLAIFAVSTAILLALTLRAAVLAF